MLYKAISAYRGNGIQYGSIPATPLFRPLNSSDFFTDPAKAYQAAVDRCDDNLQHLAVIRCYAIDTTPINYYDGAGQLNFDRQHVLVHCLQHGVDPGHVVF